MCSNLVAEYQYNLYSFGEEKSLGLRCTGLKYNYFFFCNWLIHFHHSPLCFYFLCIYTKPIILSLEEPITSIRCREGCSSISFLTLYFHTQIMNEDHWPWSWNAAYMSGCLFFKFGRGNELALKKSNQTCLETAFAELADVCHMTHAMDIRHNLEASKAVKCMPVEKLRQNELSRSIHNLTQQSCGSLMA